jgi:hypothetical protein
VPPVETLEQRVERLTGENRLLKLTPVVTQVPPVVAPVVPVVNPVAPIVTPVIPVVAPVAPVVAPATDSGFPPVRSLEERMALLMEEFRLQQIKGLPPSPVTSPQTDAEKLRALEEKLASMEAESNRLRQTPVVAQLLPPATVVLDKLAQTMEENRLLRLAMQEGRNILGPTPNVPGGSQPTVTSGSKPVHVVLDDAQKSLRTAEKFAGLSSAAARDFCPPGHTASRWKLLSYSKRMAAGGTFFLESIEAFRLLTEGGGLTSSHLELMGRFQANRSDGLGGTTVGPIPGGRALGG